MPRLNQRINLQTKTKLKISPALIKKMEIFSSNYQNIQNKFNKTPLSNNVTYSDNVSLDSFLIEQVSNLFVSDTDKNILFRMIELLDENGLFSNWILASETLQAEFSISKRKTYQLLNMFQDLEPEGVGATSVKNFLEIQIQNHAFEDNPFKENTLHILSYEKDILDNNLKGISAKTGISLKDIQLSLQFIKNNLVYTLPRKQFSNQSSVAVSPSANINIQNNVFHIEILEDFSYITDADLHEMLNERREKLKQILTSFFQKQNPSIYLKTGLLKPVTQRNISEITGLEPSTVSRIVNNKYLFLENKLYLLKSLFQRKVNNSAYSSIFIKNFIAKNQQKTDKALAEELKEIGINISRRTVNYYRNKFF
jgi:RNA polymerase sigma-54 factor